MASCELNYNTGEAKLFYQVGNEVFDNYKEALNNVKEGNTIEVINLNTEDSKVATSLKDFVASQNDFVKYQGSLKVNNQKIVENIATIAVSFNRGTKEGLFNYLVKEGIAEFESEIDFTTNNKVITSFGSSSLVRKMNTHEIMRELRANSAPHGYIKKGDTFQLTDSYGKTQVGDKYYSEQEIKEMTNKGEFPEGVSPESMYYRQVRVEQIEKANNKKVTPKETNDTNESLMSGLTNFINKMGISLESIESYKRKFAQKNGVLPDAKALTDIANQVIAFRNGEVTLNELTEEVSHLIVESWDQTEIERLLKNINKTQEWVEHSQAYREAYQESGAYSTEEQLEEAVRREVLGKFLANQLRNPTQRTETETNIFNYALNLLKEFFNRIRGRITESEVKELSNWSSRVNTLLRNKEIQDHLDKNNFSNSSILSPMYALSKDSKFYKIHERATKALENAENELNTLQNISNKNRSFKGKLKRLKTTLEGIEVVDKTVKELREADPTNLDEIKEKAEKISKKETDDFFSENPNPTASQVQTFISQLDRTSRLKVEASVAGIFGIFDTKVKELAAILNNLEEGDDMSFDAKQVFKVLKDHMLPQLQVISNAVTKNQQDFDQYESLKGFIEDTFSRYQNIAGEIEGQVNVDVEQKIKDRARETGGEKAVEFTEERFKKEERDHSWFFKMFGLMSQSKNPYLAFLGTQVMDMHRKATGEFYAVADVLYKKLSKHKTKLPKLAKGYFYWSHRDNQAMDDKINLARAKAFKEALQLKETLEELTKTQWTEKTIQEYIESNEIEADPKQVLTKYNKLLDRYMLDAQLGKKNSDLYARRKKQFDLMDEIGMSDDTYEIIKNQRADYAKVFRQMGDSADPTNPSNRTLEKDRMDIKAERNAYKEVYVEGTLDLKNGLEYVTEEEYDPFDKSMVRIRKGLVVKINKTRATTDAIIAFELNKYDRNSVERREQAEELSKDSSNTSKSIKEKTGWEKQGNTWIDTASMFEEIPTDKAKKKLLDIYNKEIQEHGDVDRAKEVTNAWFRRMFSISFSQEYWDSLTENKSLNSVVENNLYSLSKEGQDTVKSYMQDISNLRTQNSYILKKYQESYDYREVSVEDMSAIDKDTIVTNESLISDQVNTIRDVLEEEGVDEALDSLEFTERLPNDSYYSMFKDKNGMDYQNASFFAREDFGVRQLSDEAEQSYLLFRKALLQASTGQRKLSDVWQNVVENLDSEVEEITEENVDEISEKYLLRKIPSYFQRFAPKGYDSMLNNIENNIDTLLKEDGGLIDNLIEDKVENFELKANPLSVENNDIKYQQSASVFKSKRAAAKEAFENAKSEKQKAAALLQAYESFLHITGMDDGSFDSSTLDQSFLDNFGMKVDSNGNLTAPTSNLQDFENIVDLLDLNAIALEDYGNLLKTNVFEFNKMPKTDTERLAKGGVQSLRNFVDDMVRYREDEEESFVRSEIRRVPKLGFKRIPLDDLSTDLFKVTLAHVYNAKEYKHKTQTLETALSIRESVEKNVRVKGKNIGESNILQMVDNYMDTTFFGRHNTWRAKITIAGKQIDVTKILDTFKNFVQLNALGFSVPVALTSLTTATTNKFIQRFVNYHMYAPASNRANTEFTRLLSGGIQNVGKVYADSKIDKLMQYFGNYELNERIVNAAYGYGTRNLTDVNKMAFSVHQLGNYPVIPRVMLSKLMEYRLVDGKFISWSNFKTKRGVESPGMSQSKLKEEFNKFKNESVYDYLDVENSRIFKFEDLEGKIKDAEGEVIQDKQELKDYLEKFYSQISGDITYNIGQYDGLIDQTQKVEAQRHPVLSFLTMFKGWVSIAASRNFAPEYMNFQTGNVEQGTVTTFTSTINQIMTRAKKEGLGKASRSVYGELSPAQKANLKSLGLTVVAIGSFVLLVAALIRLADDDEEKDNYILQLTAYVALRNLNETSSSSGVGIFSELYSFLESPVSSSSTIRSAFDILNLGNMSEEVSRGQYKGWNKYRANLFKMTFMKNFYGLSPNSLAESREGYQYFIARDNLYSPISLVTLMNKQ